MYGIMGHATGAVILLFLSSAIVSASACVMLLAGRDSIEFRIDVANGLKRAAAVTMILGFVAAGMVLATLWFGFKESVLG